MSDQNQQQGNQGQGQQQESHLLDEPRRMAEQQIDQAIDQFASKVPGGSQFTPQAKEAASGILDNLENALEKEAEKRIEGLPGNLGGMLGGLFGGHEGDQGKQ